MPNWKKVVTSGSNAAFNSLIVSSTITGSISGSLTGSLFGTASWAYNVVNGSNVDTSGFVTTSSFNTFTSSINNFTASYNTGSFSGSFTGSLNGSATTLSTNASVDQINTGDTTDVFIRPNELEQSKYATLNIYNYNNFT